MNDFDMNMNWNEIAKNFQPLGLHLANEADITLPRAHYAASARSSSISRESEYGTQRGRAGTAEPFEEGLDLGLDLGEDSSGDISIELGRNAQSERAPSIASSMRMGGRASSVLTDRTARSGTAELGGSVLGAGEERLAASRAEFDIELEPPGDLGLDMGEGFEMPPLEKGHAEDDQAPQDQAPGDNAPDDHAPMDVDVPEVAGPEGLQGLTEEQADLQARARRECKQPCAES